MVFYNTEHIINDIARECDRFIILGGNHDYYSPSDTGEYNINSIDFLNTLSNVYILSTDWYKDGDCLFLPWFWFNTPDRLDTVMKENKDCKFIYTHADLMHLTPEQKAHLKGKIVFSGHIHTPYIEKNYITLGSCYALTFADANQERGFYTIEDFDVHTMKFYPNEKSIKFHRLYGEEVLNSENIINSKDYVELYINNSEYTKESYTEVISRVNEKCTCNVVLSKSEETQKLSDSEIKDFDIIDICKEHIPDYLQEKFQKIVENIKN